MKSSIGRIVTLTMCATLAVAAQQISTTYDHHYDFSRVKTFTVKIEPGWGNPPIEAYAEEAVAKELRAKGWTQERDESSADVLVVLQGTVETKKTEESYYDGGIQVPAGVSGPAGVSNARVIEEKIGHGTINIFDTKTRQLIFSGTGADELSQQVKKNEEKIKKGVEKVFKDFPPRPREGT